MLKVYYRICIDFIDKAKQNNRNWKFPFLMYISAFFSLIILSIYIIFVKSINYVPENNYPASDKLYAIFVFFIPALLINYFLIIYKNKSSYLHKKQLYLQ